MKHTATWILFVVVLAASLLAGRLDAREVDTAATSPSVHIDNFTFTPQEITVTRGTTVTWVNDDDIPHALATSNKAFRSKAMDTEEKFSFTFKEPGTYEYFCSLHPHMQGKVIVRD